MSTENAASNTASNTEIDPDQEKEQISPGGNTPEGYPPAEEVARLKAEHRLSWHPRGGWCRKFPGDANRTYFGKVTAAAAVKAMHAEEERRKRGERVDPARDMLLKDAVNHFLTHLDAELLKGDIGGSQRASYGDEIDKFINLVGKQRRLSEFCRRDAPEVIFAPLRAAAITRGLSAAEKHIVQIRSFLRWCSDVRRFMAAPFYADSFNPPSVKERRARTKGERREKGTAAWTPAEVRGIVDAAKEDVHRYAQVLLMLNGGMGATDLSNLDDAEIRWDISVIDTDRSKTQVPRIVPLWDITVEAMKASRAARAAPADPTLATRFFLTPHGRPLVVEQLADEKRLKLKRTDALKNWFYKVVNGSPREKWKKKAIRLPHLKRHRGGVYTLRSVFVNLAAGHGQDRNLDAIILGQKFDRENMEFYMRGDNRQKLVAIVEHVRRQIWPGAV